MKVQFLGTSASPSMPVLFCHCEVCSIARRVRGKNLRRRSSIIINNDLLVDIGPDIISSSYEYNTPISEVDICLQTHCHEDHFDPELIISRHRDYGTIVVKKLVLVGSKQTLTTMSEIIKRRCDYGDIFEGKVQEDLRIKLFPIEPYEDNRIGNYIITAYPANHGHNQGCYLYAIEHNGQSLFYGTDTSVFYEEVWKHLEIAKKNFDLIILDHTYGIGYESKQEDHLATKDFIGHVQQFIKGGMLKNKGQVYATHISHEGFLEHTVFDNYARKHNYKIAYDGLLLDLDK